MLVAVIAANAQAIANAARLLRSGALVAFPTETVSGLGADAANGPQAAARGAGPPSEVVPWEDQITAL